MNESVANNPEAEIEPAFLPHPAMDRMLDALVALSAELWAERDRRRVLEQVLARRGLLEAADIEGYRGSDTDEQQRKQERDAYVRRVLGSFSKL
jgi:hypothetical protein